MENVRATRRATFWCVLLLAALTAWNVRSVVGFDFVGMDDDINVSFNPHLGPPGKETLTWMLTDASYVRRYLPVGWLAFSLVYEFSGLSPGGYHAANALFHVINTLLLFLLVRSLLRRWGGVTDPVWLTVCAALGAGLWAWHPYRAETVGWVSGLTYGPSGTFALLSVLGYLKVLSHRSASTGRTRWLLATGAAYLASMLAYPISLGLLGVFVLFDYADRCHPPPDRLDAALIRPSLMRHAVEKAVLAVPAVAVLALTIVMRVESNSFWAKPVSLQDFGWMQRGAQAAYAWAHYVAARWWPIGLTPAPTRLLEVNPGDAIFVASAIFVLGVTIWWARVATLRRSALLWWLAFIALLLPMLGFMEHPYFACDRYDYLAGMVVSAALAIGLAKLRPARRGLGIGLMLAALGSLAALQQRQLSAWKDGDSLERCMLANSENPSFVATRYSVWAKHHAAYGSIERANEILREGEQRCGSGQWLDEAREEVAKAQGSAAALHTRMAMDFSRGGRPREAREHFHRALRLDPGLAAAGINYAVFQAITGQPLDALHWYFQAVAGSRDGVPPAARFRVLGLIAGQFAAARQFFLARHAAETALADAPTPAEAAQLRLQVETYRRAESTP